MKKKFHAVYFTLLTDQEIEEVVEYDLIDDDERFEEFCLKSKNIELLGIFPYEYQARDFIEFLVGDSDIDKVSGPIFIVRQIEIDIDRTTL